VRKTFGRTSAPWRVSFFAARVHDAIKRGDDKESLDLALQFFGEFIKSWDSGDATFFRNLALCIERQCHNLNRAELWVAKNLFTDPKDPERQTEFFTYEEILRKFKDERPKIPMTDIPQLARTMAKMGAAPKNSAKRRVRL
jgi:hypothetical protein